MRMSHQPTENSVDKKTGLEMPYHREYEMVDHVKINSSLPDANRVKVRKKTQFKAHMASPPTWHQENQDKTFIAKTPVLDPG